MAAESFAPAVTGSGLLMPISSHGTAWPAPWATSTPLGQHLDLLGLDQRVNAFAAAATPLPAAPSLTSFALAASSAGLNDQALLRSFLVQQQHQQTQHVFRSALQTALVQQECATSISPPTHPAPSSFAMRSTLTLSQMQGSDELQHLRGGAAPSPSGLVLLSQYNMLMMANAAAQQRPATFSSSPSSHDEHSSDSGATKTSSPTSVAEHGEPSRITTFPRRKAGEDMRTTSAPVLLNKSCIEKLFHLSLQGAASKLGISRTAMKSACRKLGIQKWPHRLQLVPRASSPSSSSTPPRPRGAPARQGDAEKKKVKGGDAGGGGEHWGRNCAVANLIN